MSRCTPAGGLAGLAAGAGVLAAFAGPARLAGATRLLVITPLLMVRLEPGGALDARYTRWLRGAGLPLEGSKLVPEICVEPGGYADPEGRPTATIRGAPGCGGAAGGLTGTQFSGGWFTAVTGAQVFQVVPGIHPQP